MSLLSARLVALFGLFGLTMVAGLGPVAVFIAWQRKHEHWSTMNGSVELLNVPGDDKRSLVDAKSAKILHLLLVFGGGVLLSTCFVHMIPEIQANYQTYLANKDNQLGNDHDNNNTMKMAADQDDSDKTPWVEICICLGLFLTHFVEEIILLLIGHSTHSHHHHGGEHLEIIGCLPEGTGTCGDYGTLIRPVNECKKTCDDFTRASIIGQSRRRLSSNDTSTKSIYEDEAIVELKRNDELTVKGGHPFRDNLDFNDNQWTKFARGLIIVVAFLAHSIFDGVAIGLQSTANSLWTMFFAICLHKLVVVFAIGFELYEKTTSLALTAIHITLFSAMSPIGILMAILTERGLSEDGSLALILLNAAATGAILYIVFLEILQADRCPDINGLVQLTALVSGFALMTFVTLKVSDGD